MTKSGRESRRYNRIFFSNEENILATLSLPGKPDDAIEAKIMNLSEGGLFITLNHRDKQPFEFQKGMHFILHHITGTKPPIKIDDTKLVVRWLFQDKFLDHIGFGCEFKDMSAESKKQILQVLDTSGQ